MFTLLNYVYRKGLFIELYLNKVDSVTKKLRKMYLGSKKF